MGRGSPEDGSSYTAHPEDVDVSNATFTSPDLKTFCYLEELGLEVTGQQTRIAVCVGLPGCVTPEDWCRQCGCPGRPRDTVTRELAHEPLGWRSTGLLVRGRFGVAPDISAAAGHDRGPLETSVQNLARGQAQDVARPGRDSADGRVHRLQNRRR